MADVVDALTTRLTPADLKNFIANNSDINLSAAITALQGETLTYNCPKCVDGGGNSTGIITVATQGPSVKVFCDICDGMLKTSVQFLPVTNKQGSFMPLYPIAFSPMPPSVAVGATITLTNATPGGTWSSLNADKATVNAAGVVTGVGAGTVTIKYTIGTAYVSVDVTVTS